MLRGLQCKVFKKTPRPVANRTRGSRFNIGFVMFLVVKDLNLRFNEFNGPNVSSLVFVCAVQGCSDSVGFGVTACGFQAWFRIKGFWRYLTARGLLSWGADVPFVTGPYCDIHPLYLANTSCTYSCSREKCWSWVDLEVNCC